MIDTNVNYVDSAGKDVPVQPLNRMLYLPVWDVYVPASYKGAPPACHFCRQVGHKRAVCPSLAKRQCFKCHKLGHTARFCRVEEKSFEEAVNGYEAAQARATSGSSTGRKAPKQQNPSDELQGLIKEQLALQTANANANANSPSNAKVND
ncbi:hypothetical protein [Parasitella parasitica]|uniref:CCHC-type domain-containing protein n=1 Tax=Parasitella parasitica TaxID=35722 RepID=A0A0B7NHE1_9FUNG|nr:hypothetical protein [Parasitella parasitica]